MNTIQELLNQQNGLNIYGTTPTAPATNVQNILNPQTPSNLLAGYSMQPGLYTPSWQPTIPAGVGNLTAPNLQPGLTIQPNPQQTTTPTNTNIGNTTTTYNTTPNNNQTPSATAPTPAPYNPLTGQPLLVGQTVTKDGITYTGTSNPPTTLPVPGSAASIAQGTGYTYTQTPEEIEEERRRNEAQTYLESGFNESLDPNVIYQNQLRQFQAEIDSINNIYADQLAQARVQGQGRIESRQFAQGRAGQIGSGTGEAGINAVQDANRQVENSIMLEKANAIASIMGKVRKGAAEDLAAKTKAKKEGADAILAEGIAVKERRKSRLTGVIADLIAKGIDVADMTPEELKSITSGLGVSSDDVTTAYNEAKSKKDAIELEASQAEEKRLLDLEKTKADIEQTKAETGQIGKMTPYQAAQLGISQGHLKLAQEKAAREIEAEKDLFGDAEGSYTGEQLILDEKDGEDIVRDLEESGVTTSAIIKIQHYLNAGYSLKDIAKETSMPTDVFNKISKYVTKPEE